MCFRTALQTEYKLYYFSHGLIHSPRLPSRTSFLQPEESLLMVLSGNYQRQMSNYVDWYLEKNFFQQLSSS